MSASVCHASTELPADEHPDVMVSGASEWLPVVVAQDPTLAAFERFLRLADEQDAASSERYEEHALQHWTPNPGPQSDFFWSREREVLYGGAAGGGKSSSEIALPLRWCNHRAFRCLILRRETTQLQDLLDKAAELYPKEYPGVRYRGDDDTYTFPSGAVVRFAHCKDANDWEKYAGHEYHLVEFDELTHFLLKQYREITKRIRSAVPKLPRFTRAGTNPGGIGHAWTFARWSPWLDPTCVLEDWESMVIDAKTKVVTRIKGKGLPARLDDHGAVIPPCASGQALYVAQTKNGERFSSVPVRVIDTEEEFPTLTRSFIPARLTDNPKLTEADPMYEQSLLDNDPVRVAQLLDGNWLVKPAAGLLFKRDWFEIVDESPMDGVCARVWDLAGTEPSTCNTDPDWTCGLLGSLSTDGYFYLEHMERFREGPGGVRAHIRTTAELDTAAVPIRLPQDPGQAGKDQGASYVQMLQGYDVRVKPVTGSKLVRASVASAQASPKATGSLRGRIRVVRAAWNEALFEELEAFPTGAHDDQVDVLSDLIAELTLGGSGTVGVHVVG